MANQWADEEVIFFENVLEKFDPNNITARNVEVYTPNATTFERGGLSVWRPQPQIRTTTAGRDVSGGYKDVNELYIPSILTEGDIINDAFTMTAVELNDESRRERTASKSVQTLSAAIDRKVATEVALKGSLVVTNTAEISTYDHVSEAEALMMENDIAIEQPRCLIFNARDGARVAGNLAGREYLEGRPLTAYERSSLPPIAGFDTLKASFMSTITASAISGETVTGAQRYVPKAEDANGVNVDNRTMTLTVSATANMAVGDAITIAGVNAVSHINKQDTGQLKTFRITEVVDGTNIKITPPIIVGDGTSTIEDQYANVSAAAADLAVISAVNLDTKPANIFFDKSAVELVHGHLPTELLGPTLSTMRATTDSGLEIIFAKQGEIDDLKAKYRLSVWARANVLNPEMCGIILGAQTP